PGLAPITFSAAAADRLASRTSPVQSWYLDLSMIQKYWGDDRVYHHTAPISALFGLREALALVLEEGLENRFARHRRISQLLWEGLEGLGLKLVVEAGCRLPSLTTVYAPEGVAEADIRKRLLLEYGIEIGGGLGPFKGRVWRIGLMGESCTERNVLYLLSALKALLG
ncbi:MAG: aminotransferase class V-fold PLP-dependent enzyme, partial [Armatimonadota bacterium]|nr:aminotransferase class V-fold PLP-dependent enzyme [Armatimonadota bacterium]